MLINSARMLADQLMSGSSGADSVNTRLAVIPIDSGSIRPSNVIVEDESRNPQAALANTEYVPAVLPCLIVTQGDNVTFDGNINQGLRDANVSLVVRYFGSNVDPERSNEAAMLTLRAVVQSLGQWLEASDASARIRNGIAIIYCVSIEMAPAYIDEKNPNYCTGGLRIVFRCRDMLATG